MALLRNIFIIIAVIMAVMTCAAKTKRDVSYTCQPENVMQIDSIDYRTDLTRVYAKLIGTPHTSNCIEEIAGATDIDGVDFGRWYQFEDDGIISIEIDFPAMPTATPFSITATTKRGKWKITLK